MIVNEYEQGLLNNVEAHIDAKKNIKSVKFSGNSISRGNGIRVLIGVLIIWIVMLMI